jgi:hypothetical protein
MCKDCNKKYIGQTGQTFKIRYNEHIRAICPNKSGTIQNTMEILRITKIVQFMNTLQRYHVYKNRKTEGNVLNDTYAENEYPVF